MYNESGVYNAQLGTLHIPKPIERFIYKKSREFTDISLRINLRKYIEKYITKRVKKGLLKPLKEGTIEQLATSYTEILLSIESLHDPQITEEMSRVTLQSTIPSSKHTCFFLGCNRENNRSIVNVSDMEVGDTMNPLDKESRNAVIEYSIDLFKELSKCRGVDHSKAREVVPQATNSQ